MGQKHRLFFYELILLKIIQNEFENSIYGIDGYK